jgi:hypothetical protein
VHDARKLSAKVESESASLHRKTSKLEKPSHDLKFHDCEQSRARGAAQTHTVVASVVQNPQIQMEAQTIARRVRYPRKKNLPSRLSTLKAPALLILRSLPLVRSLAAKRTSRVSRGRRQESCCRSLNQGLWRETNNEKRIAFATFPSLFQIINY